MNTSYKENTPDNFWQIRWLDRYMEGHNGFIAGGCFKNILSGERVKDIDIFFESNDDFQDAVDLFNSDGYVKDGWKFKYRNEKVCAFQKDGEKYGLNLSNLNLVRRRKYLGALILPLRKWLISSNLNTTIAMMIFLFIRKIVGYEYRLLHHENFSSIFT